MNDETGNSKPQTAGSKRRHWLRLGMVAGLGSALTLGVIGSQACAGGWFRHGGGSFGTEGHSQEQVLSRVERVLDHIDATPEQRQGIEQIVRAAWDDLQASGERHRANRQGLLEVLQAENIDRARLQALRDDEMDLVAQASSRVTEALADVAEQLNQAQRQELVEGFNRHRR